MVGGLQGKKNITTRPARVVSLTESGGWAEDTKKYTVWSVG